MSRSFKKVPVCKDRNIKFRKGQANRAVRRAEIVADGGSYRKHYETWNISEYSWFKTEEEFRRDWEDGDIFLHRRYRTFKEAYRWWIRNHRSK